MLDKLDAIDWDRLTHAYGHAGDVPALIRALTSPDPEQWVGALSGLYDALCHQTCTVYEATPPAIPFLLELLGHRQVRCRGKILGFLGDAARATSPRTDLFPSSRGIGRPRNSSSSWRRNWCGCGRPGRRSGTASIFSSTS
jgi:hypothetical protein